MPKASRLDRPNATYETKFQSYRAAAFWHMRTISKATVIFPAIILFAVDVQPNHVYHDHESLRLGAPRHGTAKTFHLKQRRYLSRTQISIVSMAWHD